ncbi:MAG: purine-nucleoside phosphorylase, partial [Candidatus Cryptobacteroides sp.]|nr:purine-nucleoside phosphorylase [Candidatus Cryptobacteroides sp.]
YSYELFNFYDVERIIRVGTCGALDKDTKLGSVILAQAACSDSNYGGTLGIDRHFSPCADFQLLRKAAETAERMGIDYRAGNVMSSDAFYASATETDWARLGVLGVEMEAYGLYINAAMAGKKALTILSVSDNVVTGEELSPEQRQTGLRNMIELALEL